MVVTTNLKLFCRELVRYVGTGYKYIKIVQIPKDKTSQKSDILAKMEKIYSTNLTRGKRQAKRLRGEANFGAINFLNTVVLLKTEGKEEISKKFEFINFNKIEIKISDFSGIFLYLYNGKISIKISRNMYLNFKGEYQQIFQEGKKHKFDMLQKKWANLPHYVGIGEQRKNLLVFLLELKKKYSRKWNLNY